MKIMKSTYIKNLPVVAFLSAMIIILSGCTEERPADAVRANKYAKVTPDNGDAVLPPNIAPLNFRIDEEGEGYYVRSYSKKGDEIVCTKRNVEYNVGKWHQLLETAKGDTLYTEIYVKKGGRWSVYQTVKNAVATEDIDRYVSYRMIEPSYVEYEEMSINQRDLTDFSEKVIYSNMPFGKNDEGQCVNCHSYRNYNSDGRMQLHVRERMGGTLIVEGDRVTKINLATDSTAAGRYPAWHPTKNLIAYSVNATGQVFHTKDTQKVEVIDFGSDLTLYDIDNNTVYGVSMEKDEYESFPAWSPDGKTLYYTSAHYVQKTDNIDAELDADYQNLKYNICRKSFDDKSMTFSAADTVFNARALGKSAALPRVSPDGKYMLFGLADYGNFHIWHKNSDLYVMRLDNGEVYPLTEANSDEADSYHNWSSNGRWIIFSSRRDDGNYTRLYISYFDKNGKAHKAFVMPQKHPDYYANLFKSYNVPEFMVKPVSASKQKLYKSTRGNALPASYGGMK